MYVEYRKPMRDRMVRLARWRSLIIEWGEQKVLLDKEGKDYTYICPFCWEQVRRKGSLKIPMRVIVHTEECLYGMAWKEHVQYQGK